MAFAQAQPRNLKMVLAARRLSHLHELKQKVHEKVGQGVQIYPIQLDVSQVEQPQSVMSRLPPDFRDIDILINNA